MVTPGQRLANELKIGRAPYFTIGLALFLFKFGIDWTVARQFFGRPWSALDYLAPGSSLAAALTDVEQRTFYLTMLLIALPFIFVGVVLTAMRLRSVGMSAGWTWLFFVPAANFALFAVLAALPPKRPGQENESPAAAASQQIPLARVAPILPYGADGLRRAPWFDRILPVDPAAAKFVAILAPIPVTLLATYVSIQLFKEYGWGVFVGVPFAIGLMSSMLYAARTPKGVAGCVGVACLSLTLYGAALLLVAFEGAACLIMAAPLAYPTACAGALVGGALAGVRPMNRVQDARRVVVLMLLFLPFFVGAERLTTPPAPVYAVTSSVDIDAPPSRVWPHVVGFRDIPPPSDWFFRTGVAYPMHAEITGAGVGAVRRCVFSTGAFVEPIRVWDEPRLLKFDVTSNPPPMKEWSPWSNVHPPHLENFLVSQGGQFKLIELPGHRTRLEGTTWYQHHMWPASYWRLWSDFIIHRIHLRVLNHVKALSTEEA